MRKKHLQLPINSASCRSRHLAIQLCIYYLICVRLKHTLQFVSNEHFHHEIFHPSLKNKLKSLSGTFENQLILKIHCHSYSKSQPIGPRKRIFTTPIIQKKLCNVDHHFCTLAQTRPSATSALFYYAIFFQYNSQVNSR